MKSLAIRNLYPSVTTVGGEKYCWDSEGNKVEIDEAKIAEEVKKLQADYDKQAYARSRAKSYDPIPEQLDQIYHDIDGWKAKIKAVKDKYPKP